MSSRAACAQVAHEYYDGIAAPLYSCSLHWDVLFDPSPAEPEGGNAFSDELRERLGPEGKVKLLFKAEQEDLDWEAWVSCDATVLALTRAVVASVREEILPQALYKGHTFKHRALERMKKAGMNRIRNAELLKGGIHEFAQLFRGLKLNEGTESVPEYFVIITPGTHVGQYQSWAQSEMYSTVTRRTSDPVCTDLLWRDCC
ncbi:hypothetical protein L226DRAFT_539740 [Lentinus tigrinus ALCF2SS1-7]|uniref:Uncharacterized protein n=1 Tax=Lentinus tigrinus ALCF2SS1-6 TaxID=1328759 RepID=A0A5C2SAX1_9APHY|nr:hypothetical protein L227DRAFT_97612 [Lentinus tigrinus ALCF2SS1-6]RPD69557.1 hypothetical protein L226DRAFT_539740 [Lentinus tigrinus ALCF2SS1-7]